MRQKVNEDFAPLFTERKRYYILMGGRGAGRSKTVSQYIIAKLLDAERYFRCAMMRFVRSDIKTSIYQDIVDTAEEQGVDHKLDIRTSLQIGYGKNKVIGLGFRKSSSDQKAKLKSLAGFNCIAIEEADEPPEEDFLQLDDSIRTKKADIAIILALNSPHRKHWIIKRWFNLEPAFDEDGNEIEGFFVPKLKPEHAHNTCFIHTSYLNNLENITESTRANFEAYRKTNPEHYWGMIRGYVSAGAKGRIYKNWKPMTAEDFEALPYPSYYALDFGFTNDPAALVEIKEHNNQVWVRCLIYKRGLTNQMLARTMETLGVPKTVPIYADSAEPKSIKEIELEGFYILPSLKGADSIRSGITHLQACDVSYVDEDCPIVDENEDTRELRPFDTETQQYVWALDKNKEPTNEPIDDYNHALDATRYGKHTRASEGFQGLV